MREMLVAGNWKMNGSKAVLEAFVSELNQIDIGCQCVVCPPAVYLAQAQSIISNANVTLGAQNLDAHQSGAFTGEVSAEMLLDHDCRYVIVGHSERRAMFFESSELVATKFVAAVGAGLKAILCVGETKNQRDSGEVEAVIREQLLAVVDTAGISSFNSAVIAYEPVWAIGTGDSATPDQAEEIHLLIREILSEFDRQIGEAIQILYGGSVTADNAQALFSMPNIDGALVGGASLKADSFAEICQAAS